MNDRLVALLRSRGWSHGRLAREVGVDTRTVARWVEDRSRPQPESAAKVAKALGDVSLLIGWGYEDLDLETTEEADLLLAEVRRTNMLLQRIEGFMRDRWRENV